MASKEAAAPVRDLQQQDEECSEETHKTMTRNLLLSGVQNLAMSDESLTHQEEVQLLAATKVTLGETVDPAVEVGQDLRGMAEEVDGLLNDVTQIVEGLLDDNHELSAQRLLEFFMTMAQEIMKNGIKKAVIMIIVMVGYALIRRYLRRYVDKDILDFIEKMASFLYQIFVKFGILDWIMTNGGWKMLKSLTSGTFWAVIGGMALVITGISAYNYFYS